MKAEDKYEEKNISLPAELAEGVYSNLAIISHTPTEFIVDFVRTIPNIKAATVKARVILTPDHAKRFAAAMLDNVERYEQEFGEIKITNPHPPKEVPQSFNGPTTKGEA